MNMSVDLDEVKTFITSDEFKQFIIDNNTDFAVPVFIFQVLAEKIKEIENTSK